MLFGFSIQHSVIFGLCPSFLFLWYQLDYSIKDYHYSHHKIKEKAESQYIFKNVFTKTSIKTFYREYKLQSNVFTYAAAPTVSSLITTARSFIIQHVAIARAPAATPREPDAPSLLMER